MTDQPSERSSEFLIYRTEDGATRVETRLSGDTVWLSINRMAELFQRDKSVISRHIRNVFQEGELQRDESTVVNFATVQIEGDREVTRDVEYFSFTTLRVANYRSVFRLSVIQARPQVHFLQETQLFTDSAEWGQK